MNDFVCIPASKSSLSKRKLVCGIGINDARYTVGLSAGGRRVPCPIYSIWRAVVKRCYSEAVQKRQPAYRGCSMSDEWLLFSNFRMWVVKQSWVGKDLDKDIIKSGNKLYSSETCIFVSHRINTLLISAQTSKGKLSTGVSYEYSRYRARCHSDGGGVDLGRFDTEKEASDAYLSFKSKCVLKVASEQSEPLRGYLTRISKEIANGEYYK